MICDHEKIEKKDIGGGVLAQILGSGQRMTVFHWDLQDKSIVKTHQHPNEQFGYVIKGELLLTIRDETFSVKAGDGYFIPSDAPHGFTAVGETEAIDVFSPVRKEIPWAE